MKPTDALPHPLDWKTTTIGQSVEIKRGVSWSKEQEFSGPNDGRIPVIRISNVQETLELNALIYISGLNAKAINSKKVSSGWSIIVGSNGNRNRVGNAIFIKNDMELLFASFLLATKPYIESHLNAEYFFRWLSTEQVQAYLSASSEGSTGLNNLSHSFFKKMTIPFPPNIDEQAAIARILDAADNAIERTREAIDKAQEVKRSLLQWLFSHGTRREDQKKSPVGPIPKSWEVVPVRSVVTNFQYGLSVSMETKGDLPILRMGNIQKGEVLLEDLKYLSLPEKITAAYIVKRGDVLFNRTNSQDLVGKVGIYRSDRPVTFASYLIRICPDPQKVDNYYLGQLLNSYPAQCRIKRYATPGVEQVNINATNLGKVIIPIPVGNYSLEEQREIASILEQADENTRTQFPVLKSLQELKRSLMHDLLTGKVRVKNLEA